MTVRGIVTRQAGEASKMKAAAYRYLVAHTLAFTMTLGAVTAISLMLLALHAEGALAADVVVWLWILLMSVPAGLLGLILATLFPGPFLFQVAARIQGWPFTPGEEVVILTGRHKNMVTKIYEIWEERGEVRVDLGEDAKQNVKDVYSALAVCRTRSPVAARHTDADSPADTSQAGPGSAETVAPARRE